MPRILLYVLLTIGLVFVAAGLAMVATGAQNGWPTLLFFGMCTATFAGQLWPGLVRQEPRSPADVLAAYPGPVELRTGRAKTLFILLGAIVFAGLIVWMLLNDSIGGWRAWVLWPGAALIALSIPFLLRLLVKGGALVLTAEGFELRDAGARSTATPWQATSPFEVVTLPPAFTPLVAYDDSRAAGGRMAGASTALMGRTSGLPDNYGLPHEQLAALLNAWRERALAGR